MYGVVMIDRYSDKVLEKYEEIFETEEEAAQYLFMLEDEFAAGAVVLDLAGEGYIDPDDVKFLVYEL